MRTKNVQETLDTADVWAVPESVIKRPDQYLRAGDSLISSANSWNLVGKCCLVPELSEPTTFGGFVTVLRADESRVDSAYLHRWFCSPWIQRAVRSFGRRTTSISNLDLKRCQRLPITLPPLIEQRRIAQVLDAADALRAKRRRVLHELGPLPRVLFAEMFDEGPRLNGAREPLGAVGEVVSGLTKGRRAPSGPLREVPYLAVSNVQDQRLANLATVKTIYASEREIERYRLLPGDLLLTEGGDPDKLGRGTLWRGELPLCLHQNHVFRVRIADEMPLAPAVLQHQVASLRGRAYFLRSAKQTTGIASINASQLKAFPVFTPPINLQSVFIERLARFEKLRAATQAHLAHVDALFASLQHRAFAGEL
jgi:type I restriction enzyme S subunit